MNWVELVQKHWPNITDEEASAVLWNATSFPMGDAEEIEQQIISAYNSSGGIVDAAIALAEMALEKEFERHTMLNILKD